ncbi:uncharacterized protein [Porites lutea]|uniref:uncharacterized protein n=1 Tax=Porites lutea TaxID=51062 RepID=UPI003CC5CD8B
MMKIPACACPSLSIGGTYNALASMAGGRIFPTDIPTTTTKLNTITSDFQLVQKSRDVSKLLDFSAEVSLKIGTNLINADWAGQFIKETKNEEEMISVMAVMKCTKLTETINRGQVEPFKNVAGIGTHYVRSVKYGGELVASLTFKSEDSSDIKKFHKGVRMSPTPLGTFVDGGLVAALNGLFTTYRNFTDLRIRYYDTVSANKFPTTVDGLIEQIRNFPAQMAQIQQGIPLEYELVPVSEIGLTGPLMVQHEVQPEDLLDRFDDLRRASGLAKKYLSIASATPANDFVKFLNEATGVKRAMKKAIRNLHRDKGERLLNESIQAYDKALGGQMNFVGKFVIEWRRLTRGIKKKLLLEITVLCGRGIKRNVYA